MHAVMCVTIVSKFLVLICTINHVHDCSIGMAGSHMISDHIQHMRIHFSTTVIM